MSQASHVIGKFGGPGPASRILGKPLTTVRSWVEKGWIPAWHQRDVLERAQAHDIPLTPDDFFAAQPAEDAA